MNVRYKLLIAAPEGMPAARLEESFSRCGYDVITARTEKQALSLCASHFPDMILLEGSICPRPAALTDSLRRISAVPLLIITDEARPEERIAAYDAGADDLIHPEVCEEELLARCRRALRRSISYGLDPSTAYEGVFRTGELTVDFRLRRVFVNDRDAGLTQREWRLVALLACHAGQVLEYDDIIGRLWGIPMADGNQILRVNLANIRRKLGEDPRDPRYIFTHAGVGYSMADPDGSA